MIVKVFKLGFYLCHVEIGNSLAYVKFSYEDTGHISHKKNFRTALDSIRTLEQYSGRKGWSIA